MKSKHIILAALFLVLMTAGANAEGMNWIHQSWDIDSATTISTRLAKTEIYLRGGEPFGLYFRVLDSLLDADTISFQIQARAEGATTWKEFYSFPVIHQWGAAYSQQFKWWGEDTLNANTPGTYWPTGIYRFTLKDGSTAGGAGSLKYCPIADSLATSGRIYIIWMQKEKK